MIPVPLIPVSNAPALDTVAIQALTGMMEALCYGEKEQVSKDYQSRKNKNRPIILMED
jgi:hypothetical protein